MLNEESTLAGSGRQRYGVGGYKNVGASCWFCRCGVEGFGRTIGHCASGDGGGLWLEISGNSLHDDNPNA
ncbi:hypothetical protein [Absidia glauca]|uniref:Uncharacterized protein n=1 Tax=Absidia glauca TaxID=4829 RepID=A0A163MMS6_ABSGL|nr:hypothetical protein [Absidia glauca]